MTPNRSDFVILNKKLEKYAQLLSDNFAVPLNELSQAARCRLGFYVYVLENVCEESDLFRITDAIIDTEFNRILTGDSGNDYGMDAVFVDEGAYSLKLFNFKYRESFKPGSMQSLNDIFTSTKFLNLALSDDKKDFSKLSEKVKDKVEKVHEILTDPQEEWKVEFYLVSNDSEEVRDVGGDLGHLANNYAIKVRPLALPALTKYMSIRPEPISAKIILDSQAVMSYSEGEKASAKSFIVRMKCSELIRITCDQNSLRDQVHMEDSAPLSQSNLDFNVLFDNVRGFVNKSKYNKNIGKTLKKNPTKFFMYNNGVTLVAKSIDAKELAGKKRVKLEINDFQVVNGGQTLRTMHDFNRLDVNNIESYLYDAEVLVRIFMPESESDEKHKIAEYTNSQNAIKPVDLKSLASEQIRLEQYLHEHDIAYARKTGDTGPDDKKSYAHTINMETFGKILKAMSGYPDKATNGLKDIFEGSYEDLFVNDFDLKAAPALIEKYFSIIRSYKNKKLRGNQLKFFYIMYFSDRYSKLGEDSIISLLETFLDEYRKSNDLTEVKALGSTSFKNEFEKMLDENNLKLEAS
ncbi:MAG: AIPR family protein [Marinobacter sp.]